MRMCQWPRTPSEYWKLSEQGYTETEQKAFDRAVLDFAEWVENKRKQEHLVTAPKVPQGKMYAPKYANDGEILAEYYRVRAHDPVAQSITDEDLIGLLDDVFSMAAPTEEMTRDDGAGAS